VVDDFRSKLGTLVANYKPEDMFNADSLRDFFGDGVFKFKSFSSLRVFGVLSIFTLT
jgi:hypothetical protein